MGREFSDVAEAQREARVLAAELPTELIRLEHESNSVVILIVDKAGTQQVGVQLPPPLRTFSCRMIGF